MILGVGTDICDIADIEKSIFRSGDRYLSQYCRERELRLINDKPNKGKAAAEIFASKEAIGKAVGTGLIDEFWFLDIEVEMKPNLKPIVSLSESAISFINAKHSCRGSIIHLTVSTTKSYALAFAVLNDQ